MMPAALGARLGIYAAVVALLVGLGAGLTWYLLADTIAGLRAERDIAQESLRLAKRAQAAGQQAQQRRAAVRTKRAADASERAQALERALVKAQAWADEPVPQEALDALR